MSARATSRPARRSEKAPPARLLEATWTYKSLQDAVRDRWSDAVAGAKVAIYGSNLSGQLLYLALAAARADVVHVVDGDTARHGQPFPGGLTVQAPETLASHAAVLDVVAVASSSPGGTQAIRQRLAELALGRVTVLAAVDLATATGARFGRARKPVLGLDERVRQQLPFASDLRWMRAVASALPVQPRFYVSVGPGAVDAFERTRRSLYAQVYDGWALETPHRAPSSAKPRVRPSTGPAVRVAVEAGDVLAPHALFEVAVACNLEPGVRDLRLALAPVDGRGRCVNGVGRTPALVFRVERTGHSSGARPHTIDAVGGFRVRTDAGATSGGQPAVGKGAPLDATRWGSPRQANRLPALLNRAPLQVLDPDRIRRVLVVKLDHLGDVILSLPAIQELRRLLPRVEISILAGSWSRTLLEHTAVANGLAARVLTFDAFSEVSGEGNRRVTARELAGLNERLRPFAFDLAVDLRRVPDTRYVTDALEIPLKLAFGDRDVAEQLSVGPFSNEARKDHSLHIVEQLRTLVRAHLGQGIVEPEGWLPQMPAARRVLPAGLHNRALVVGMAPGCGDELRRWPATRFGALAGRLARELDAGIAWFGTAREQGLIDAARGAMATGDRGVVMAGALSLTQFMAAVRECDLFVGSTTGSTHVAASSDVPTLNIFSGQVSPFEWAPVGRRAFVLRTKPGCAPCYLPDGQCPYGRFCLLDISPDDAFAAARRILLTTGARARVGRRSVA